MRCEAGEVLSRLAAGCMWVQDMLPTGSCLGNVGIHTGGLNTGHATEHAPVCPPSQGSASARQLLRFGSAGRMQVTWQANSGLACDNGWW